MLAKFSGDSPSLSTALTSAELLINTSATFVVPKSNELVIRCAFDCSNSINNYHFELPNVELTIRLCQQR